MAKWVLDFYQGEQEYSDGSIEQELLDIVKSGKNLNNVIKRTIDGQFYTILALCVKTLSIGIHLMLMDLFWRLAPVVALLQALYAELQKV